MVDSATGTRYAQSGLAVRVGTRLWNGVCVRMTARQQRTPMPQTGVGQADCRGLGQEITGVCSRGGSAKRPTREIPTTPAFHFEAQLGTTESRKNPALVSSIDQAAMPIA